MGLRREIWSISTYKSIAWNFENPLEALPFRSEMVWADPRLESWGRRCWLTIGRDPAILLLQRTKYYMDIIIQGRAVLRSLSLVPSRAFEETGALRAYNLKAKL